MSRINVLDCTLRDGGYCNQWRFGQENIGKIVKSLFDANVEIIECGFLTNKIQYDRDVTKFRKIEEAEEIVAKTGIVPHQKQIVLMVNYGEYDFNELPSKQEDSLISGIRLAFHKKNKKEALRQSLRIKERGYDLYLQPMVSLSYTDAEFIELIEMANDIKPCAFYIVDSFGTMKRKELTRLYSEAEHNLAEDISLGFHGHNNMQMVFANAQTLLDMHSKHDLIVDTSIYGMGRGAGNLNTELFLGYLNDSFEELYNIKPLVKVIDRILDRFYQKNCWGYSLANYLSAAYNTHPNYAGFLSDKNAINVEEMHAILEIMDDDKRVSFDKDYIEELYTKYLSSNSVYEENKESFVKAVRGGTVLLIAPGRSSYEEREKILEYVDSRDVIVVSVNHAYEYISPSYIFVSNLRRYRELDENYYNKSIVTSNISTADAYLQIEYADLLNDNEFVRDNAGLMAIRLFMNCGVKEIVLAGFDGYSHDSEKNYANKGLVFITKKAMVDAMNEGMKEILMEYKNEINLSFLTETRYADIINHRE